MEGERIIIRLQGMDDGPNPERGWAERIDNLTIDATGTWRNCVDWKSLYYEATSQASYDPPPSVTSGYNSEYQSIYWWGQRGTARQWLLWERGSSATACALEVFDGIKQTYQVLATGRQRVETPNAGTCYLPLNGWLYIINGRDQPVRWNGRWPDYGSVLAQVGFSHLPPSPSATLGAQNNPLDAWYIAAAAGVSAPSTFFRYGYVVTYVNETGCESPPSPPVFVTGTNIASAGAGYVVRLVLGTPPANVSRVRIYRTVDLGYAASTAEGARFSFYHLVDLPSATSQGWEDGLQDGLLGHQLDESALGLYPNGASYAAVFKGTMFLSGAPSYPDRVFYSAPGLVEQFPAANTFDLGTGTGGEITGLHATQNALIVFRRRGVYLIKGDPRNGFYAETVSEDVGCIAPGAIADVPGDTGVLFFAQDGPYMLRGSLQDGAADTELKYLGGKIARFWLTEVDKGAMVGARVVRYDRDQELLFVLPTHTQALGQQQGLVYHYTHGFWSLRDFAPTSLNTQRITAMCRVDDHRGLVVVCGTTPFVPYGRLVASGDKNSDGMVWRYRLGWFGERFTRSTVSTVEVVGSLSSTHAYSPAGVGLRFAQDRKLLPLTQFSDDWSAIDFDEVRPTGTDSQLIESEYQVDTWTTSLWDTGYWQRPQTRVYPIDVQGAAGGEHQFELMGGGVDVGPVELMALGMIVVGSPGQPKWAQGRGAER
jgi:hypothetical protein